MFGNLKNKIGEVADLKKYATPQNLANSLLGSRQRSGNQTPLSVTSHTNHGFLNSDNPGIVTPQRSAFPQSPLSSSSSRSHSRQPSITSPPLSPGLSPTPPIDEKGPATTAAANNAASGAAATAALVREVGKLRAALEHEQDAHMSRQATRDVEWRARLQAAADTTGKAHQALIRSEGTVESLQGDLATARGRVEELQGRLAIVQEDCDQLEGLSVQEAAKIKHMLLNTNNELEGARAQLTERTRLHDALLLRLEAAEADCRRQRQLAVEMQQQAKQQAEQQTEHQDQQAHEQMQQQLQHLQQQLQQKQEELLLSASESSPSKDTDLLKQQLQHAARESVLLLQVQQLQVAVAKHDQERQQKQKERQQERKQYEQEQHERQQEQHQVATERQRHKSEQQRQDAEHHRLADALKRAQVENHDTSVTLRERLQQEEARSKRAVAEERQRSAQNMAAYREEEARKHAQLVAEVQQMKADGEDVRWKQEDFRKKDQQIIKELQQQLGVVVARHREAGAEVEQRSAAALAAANRRCGDLQDALEEVQRRTDAQLAEQHVSLSRLQAVLSSERDEKQRLLTTLDELSSKLEVVTGEKAKLSRHLDDHAAKVAALEAAAAEAATNTQRLEEENARLETLTKEQEEQVAAAADGAAARREAESSARVQELTAALTIAEDALAEKKQALKIQLQRVADMKKTMQREFRISPEQTTAATGSTDQKQRSVSPNPSQAFPQTIVDGIATTSTSTTTTATNNNHNTGGSSSPALLRDGPFNLYNHHNNHRNKQHNYHRSGLETGEIPAVTSDGPVDPINLEYLKHVVIKFITSREYEAMHLTKAVAALLHLSTAEEELLHATLSWRVSWFPGAKPTLGEGQKAHAIPPSS